MKIFYLSVLCCLVSVYCLSQVHPGNVSGYTLWLAAGSYNDTLVAEKAATPESFVEGYFNFNPVLDVSSGEKVFRNVIGEHFSLFAVFKSASQDEGFVVTLTRGKKSAYLTSKGVLSESDIPFDKADPAKGTLVSYLSNISGKGRRNNALVIDDYFGSAGDGAEQLMELILYPNVLSASERQQVETYLSLKYGTSKIGNYDYIDSKEGKIWDFEKNSAFSSRVTGIGRDDLLGLYQKQSGNAEKDGLYMGLGIIDTTNAHNTYAVADRTFLLWGDNGKPTVFRRVKGSPRESLERLWKIQATYSSPGGGAIATQLRISKKEFGYSGQPGDAERLWLVVNDIQGDKFDYTSPRRYMQSSEDEAFIYFDDIVWDRDGSGSDIFSFIKAPDLDMDYTGLAGCDGSEGHIKVTVYGGAAPYSVSLESAALNEQVAIPGESYEFTGLAAGEYVLAVKDQTGREQRTSVRLDPMESLGLTLAPAWHLGSSGEVLVFPQITGETEGFIFEWEQAGSVISKDKEFIASKTGKYTLQVIAPQGCRRSYPFTVDGSGGAGASLWSIYPNPVRHTDSFSIAFDLEGESGVTVKVSSVEGKTIFSKDLGRIKAHEFKYNITTSGIYLVTITIDGIPASERLIVH